VVDVIQSGILTNATLTNGRAFGTIETPGDIDMYKVYLTAGNYHINLGGDPLFGTALSDTIVRIYNSSGHLLSVDDDNGLGSSSYIDFVTGSSGYYYIAASGFTSGTGDYALALTADNVSAGQVEGILEVGMSITGRVDENFEADTYNVYLEAGITYYFKLEAQGGRRRA
jgi:hypothetical protein